MKEKWRRLCRNGSPMRRRRIVQSVGWCLTFGIENITAGSVVGWQYIVRPPESSHFSEHSPTPPRQIVDLTEEDPIELPSTLNPALGGGEEVRLCNPCVPDPNPNPLGYGRTRGHRPSHSLPSGMGNRYSSESNESSANRQAPRHYSPEFLRAVSNNGRQSLREEEADYESPLDLTTSHQRSAPCEQDLCPICGRTFPPISQEQPIEAREAHIRQCIDNYGAPAAPQPVPSARRGPAPPPPPPPVSRMLEFTATEKDCIGEDGGAAECTICMVDYEGGDLLVRLECLCKFHKHCILDWFVHKMECPVHKVA
ncbi:Zinc finger RING-type [Penicillium sp. IBT 35674x]|nr:Zinc finger RING-type [Penicillium sp. IBT 35674x]